MPNEAAEKGWASPDRPRWTLRELGMGVGVLLVVRAVLLLDPHWIAAVPFWLRLAFGVCYLGFLLAYPIILAKRRGFADAYAWPAPKKILVEAGISIPIVIGILMLFVVAGYVIRFVSPHTSIAPEIWQRAARGPDASFLVFILVCSVTFGPVAEEIFFRGFLHNGLRSRLPSILAALIQSLVFAVNHLYGPLYLSLVFFLGLILTAVYTWRKSLLTPIFVHAGFNLVSTIGILLLMASYANRPVLGIYGQDRPDGCLVNKVIPGTAAEKAGVAQGDIITNLDGKPVHGTEEISEVLRLHRAGDTVTVGIIRNGVRTDLRAVVEKRSKELPAP